MNFRAIAGFGLVLMLCAAGDHTSTPRISTEEQRVFLAQSTLKDCKWKECVLTCSDGEISSVNLKQALARINFYRRLVGVDSVILDPRLNEQAQMAAFLCHANKKLEHHADRSWRCYSVAGDSALALSNLRFFDKEDRLSKREVHPVTGFIEDRGKSNEHLGHRRWILSSRIKRLGYGATETTEAIAVEMPDLTELPMNIAPYVAYPPEGEVLRELVFPKWSLSIPLGNVDFNQATIAMRTTDGATIRTSKFKPSLGYGDPTIGWEAPSMFEDQNGGKRVKESFVNKVILVEIQGVEVNGAMTSFNYEVTIR